VKSLDGIIQNVRVVDYEPGVIWVWGWLEGRCDGVFKRRKEETF
jgi:hypothetical protein